MSAYLLFFVFGGIVFVALWRYIVRALAYCGIGFAALVAWRVFPIVLTSDYTKPIFIGGMSALVVCILCYAYIRHMIIWFYLRDTIERSKQAAQKGKLW
jgi:hypothetical protein